MTKSEKEKYEICKEIIRLADIITKENPDKTYYFTTQIYVGGKKIKISTEDMLNDKRNTDRAL